MITTIDKLFNIVYGQKEYHNKEWLEGTEGKQILISSGGEDNGIYGFFDIEPKFKAPVISVQGYGTIGQAFVQEYDCAIDDHMLILTPKEKMNLEQLYQVAYQIRLTKWKYRYGRGITPTRLRKEKIRIEDFKISLKKYEDKFMPKEQKKINIKPNKNIKLIPITELCNIERRSAIPQNAMDLNGNVPYVTTSSKDNGISNFVNEEPNTKGRCLSVALNGSCGQTFFQFDDFITSGDNAIISLKGKYNPYLLFFIGYNIYRQRWGFNYYRKLSETRLKKFLIPMPITAKGEYDLEYIEKLVKNCYGYEELKKYL
jgi:hypothetical protein